MSGLTIPTRLTFDGDEQSYTIPSGTRRITFTSIVGPTVMRTTSGSATAIRTIGIAETIAFDNATMQSQVVYFEAESGTFIDITIEDGTRS